MSDKVITGASSVSGRVSATSEETAAIVAALEVLWPKPAEVYQETPKGNDNSWRFSGRWWSKPIASRRSRPW